MELAAGVTAGPQPLPWTLSLKTVRELHASLRGIRRKNRTCPYIC